METRSAGRHVKVEAVGRYIMKENRKQKRDVSSGGGRRKGCQGSPSRNWEKVGAFLGSCGLCCPAAHVVVRGEAGHWGCPWEGVVGSPGVLLVRSWSVFWPVLFQTHLWHISGHLPVKSLQVNKRAQVLSSGKSQLFFSDFGGLRSRAVRGEEEEVLQAPLFSFSALAGEASPGC